MSTPRGAKVNLNARNGHILDRIQAMADAEDQFKSEFRGCHIPAWLKWVRQGRLAIAYVNPAYTRETGITVDAYTNREDVEIWGDDQTFNDADKEVIEKRRRVRIAELAENPMTGKMQYWVGWKWPYIVRGKVVGVWGRALPIDKEFYETHKAVIDELLSF